TLVVALAWLVTAWTTRRPYLGLLRRTIIGDEVEPSYAADPLDMESAQALVEYLAHEDPLIVVGAMNALARRGGGRRISALSLMHDDELVLRSALEHFAESDREDWFSRARKLLFERREPVRVAAARALARHRQLDAKDLVLTETPRVHAYATLFTALQDQATD